jgi:hypothetical protein
MIKLLICVILGAITISAEHDHAKHIDAKFIAGEARRIAWHKKEDIQKYIADYSDAIRFIEKKYEDHFATVSNDPEENERLEKIWTENFMPNYHDTYDRLLIISHVCQDLYEKDPVCMLPDNIWNDKYDTRGEEFRKEFLAEVHKAVENDV